MPPEESCWLATTLSGVSHGAVHRDPVSHQREPQCQLVPTVKLLDAEEMRFSHTTLLHARRNPHKVFSLCIHWNIGLSQPMIHTTAANNSAEVAEILTGSVLPGEFERKHQAWTQTGLSEKSHEQAQVSMRAVTAASSALDITSHAVYTTPTARRAFLIHYTTCLSATQRLIQSTAPSASVLIS